MGQSASPKDTEGLQPSSSTASSTKRNTGLRRPVACSSTCPPPVDAPKVQVARAVHRLSGPELEGSAADQAAGVYLATAQAKAGAQQQQQQQQQPQQPQHPLQKPQEVRVQLAQLAKPCGADQAAGPEMSFQPAYQLPDQPASPQPPPEVPGVRVKVAAASDLDVRHAGAESSSGGPREASANEVPGLCQSTEREQTATARSADQAAGSAPIAGTLAVLGEAVPPGVGTILNLDLPLEDMSDQLSALGIPANFAFELQDVARKAAASAEQDVAFGIDALGEEKAEEEEEIVDILPEVPSETAQRIGVLGERKQKEIFEVLPEVPSETAQRRTHAHGPPYCVPFDPTDVPDPLGPAGSRLSPNELGLHHCQASQALHFFPRNRGEQRMQQLELHFQQKAQQDLEQGCLPLAGPKREDPVLFGTATPGQRPGPRVEQHPVHIHMTETEEQDAELYRSMASVGRPVQILPPEVSSRDGCKPEDVLSLCRE